MQVEVGKTPAQGRVCQDADPRGRLGSPGSDRQENETRRLIQLGQSCQKDPKRLLSLHLPADGPQFLLHGGFPLSRRKTGDGRPSFVLTWSVGGNRRT